MTMTADEKACIDQLATICLNAVLIPDPQMKGLTDCWALPLEDIIMATVLLSRIGIGPPETLVKGDN